VTSCCLVVTTFEWPAALVRVLASIAGQSRWPDEVIVADDGSSRATVDVVRGFELQARCPVRFVTQPHDGFQAGRIRNAAIATTGCDYVVLLDGDMVAHPRFIEDHLMHARSGCFSQGVRIPLDARATRTQLAPGSGIPGPLSPGLGGLRRSYAVRSPAMSVLLRRAANGIVAIKSCNQGFWRSDLVSVNGFDEAMRGWGSEDKELCARLENAGVRRRTLLFAAVAFHLDHPPAPRNSATVNRARWQETVRSGRTRCEAGIDRHRR
jgi:glycosyltransferase involved in cell wall biosynthesis